MKDETVLIDRYQIREQLSRKAGRRVFLAEDLQSKDLVIIKILRFDADFQWDDLKLFEREVATLKNLDHPAIPRYLDYFEVEESNLRGFALVQTYINAPSLEHAVKQGRKFSESELIELADRLLSILLYLHELNPPVIHRDIKPSNILLTNRSGNSIGDVYLVDFGSVQTVATVDGGTISIQGSYGYMPLEQFGGRTTTASDLYSLGMTLIYVITGQHPANLENVHGQVKFDASNLSNRFAQWLEKMTQPHLDRRFESVKSSHTALLSADGSYGSFLNLRPANSQIELRRDRDRLEIKLLQIEINKIHEDFISNSLFNLFLFSCFLDIVVYFFVLPQAWTTMSWSSRSIFLIFFPLTLALWRMSEKYVARKTYTGYKVLSVDRISKTLKVGIYSKRDKKCYWDTELVKGSIVDLLVYQPSCEIKEFFDEESQQHKALHSKTSSCLFIYRGKHEHNISGNDLSDTELYWLGQEISDFLNLELQIIYPTPTVPKPEPYIPDNCVCP
jgi:serine/threonine protein kinase